MKERSQRQDINKGRPLVSALRASSPGTGRENCKEVRRGGKLGKHAGRTSHTENHTSTEMGLELTQKLQVALNIKIVYYRVPYVQNI